MAEQKDAEERTEQPTLKRLADARRDGQVPRSRELSTTMVTIAGAAAIFVAGGRMGEDMLQLLHSSLEPGMLMRGPEELPSVFYGLFLQGLSLVWPVLAIAFAATLAAAATMGGWTFNLAFKFERLDPIKGMQKLFSLRSLVELCKAVAKSVLIGAAAVGLLWLMADEILGLGMQAPEDGIVHGAQFLAWFFLLVSLPLIIVAAIDVPWQLWNHHKELRMTKQEVRDEHKETDGRPEVKAKVREMQQAAARRRMMEQVPKADVVITNPTHYAVALKYDEARMAAPVVVAKGADLIAARIREVATGHGVPLVESPRLARAVFATTDLGKPIPAGLYLAVAQILAYVYQLRDWQARGGAFPEAPQPDVDDEYLKGLA